MDLNKALGDDPNKTDAIEIEISDIIRDRLVKTLTSGLKQDVLEGLMFQYIPPEFLRVPKLNDEVKLHIHEGAKRRDAYLSEAQGLTYMSMAITAALIDSLRDEKIKMDLKAREGFIGLAMESAHLQAQHGYEQTQTRKAFILPTIKNDAIKQLLTDQVTDEFLFGKDLPEKLASLERLKKATKVFTAGEGTSQQKSGQSFLDRRANHPRRHNKPWSGQGALTNHWTFKSKMPQFGQQNQSQKPQKQKGR